MARVKRSSIARQRRRKIIKKASGYFGSKSTLFKTANEQVMRSGQYAYDNRRDVKNDYRKLWIKRINAACRPLDISYSQLIFGLHKANIDINRKMLSEMAINDEAGFKNIVEQVKKQLAK